MKKCSLCNDLKPQASFRPGKYRCLECRRTYNNDWHHRTKADRAETIRRRRSRLIERNREWKLTYLGSHPCLQCGETDPELLQFHHVGLKRDEVSNMVMSEYSIESLEKEAAQCIVLCASCHTKEHWRLKRLELRKAA